MNMERHFKREKGNSLKMALPLLTPIAGTLPVVVFFVVDCFFSYHTALLGALITYAVYFVVGVLWLKYEPPYTILILTVLFPVVIGISVIKPFNLLYDTQASIVLELVLTLLYYLFTRIQNYFRAKILLKNDSFQEFHLLKFDADLYVIKTILFLLIVHLLIVLIYSLLPSGYHSPAADMIVYYLVLFLFVMIHFVYELIYWGRLKKQILSETWLPIVDESGGVHGKVAQSVSRASDAKFLHPVIRIVLIHKGMVFLKERPSLFESETCQLDYPFERYLRFKETLEEGVKKTFAENGGALDLPSRFVFRYVHKNIKTNRLIYLYASNIHDEKLLNEIQLKNGKWWTGKQIGENLGTGLFSTYFEKEYELLNTTILMADRLMWNSED
jgi:hypothetical protein